MVPTAGEVDENGFLLGDWHLEDDLAWEQLDWSKIPVYYQPSWDYPEPYDDDPNFTRRQEESERLNQWMRHAD